jgi:hypothetical protein
LDSASFDTPHFIIKETFKTGKKLEGRKGRQEVK